MKSFYRRTLITISFVVFVFAAQAQYRYVVIGAFAIESNAQKFMGYARSKNYDANYGIYVKQKLHYVYVLKTTDRNEAIDVTKHLQTESEFKDCWVYKGSLVNETADPIVIPKTDTTTVVQAPIDTLQIPVTIDTLVAKADTTGVRDSLTDEPPMVVHGKLFRFAIQSADGNPVKGEVHQVDYKRGRDLATYKGNRYTDVLNPMKNNPMAVVCGIFGYKEVVQVFDWKDPSLLAGVKKDERGAWIVPFTLERMKKGDISVMYHVSFYKDAVVMTPGSRPELDELLNMMNDNPNYKIKIHGHCNGKNDRRIIALGETKNYFDVTGSNEINGTAKELSDLRAKAVQTYLVDHGIDKSRTEIYAWGALNMLVDEHSPSARLNDRIEIEIMAD